MPRKKTATETYVSYHKDGSLYARGTTVERQPEGSNLFAQDDLAKADW